MTLHLHHATTQETADAPEWFTEAQLADAFAAFCGTDRTGTYGTLQRLRRALRAVAAPRTYAEGYAAGVRATAAAGSRWAEAAIVALKGNKK